MVTYKQLSVYRLVGEDWRSRVYHPKLDERSGLRKAEWRLLRDEILRRDDFTCQRCFDKFRAKKYLSVHHLVPRRAGGSNCKDNLITLCHPCHDYVEVMGYSTVADIVGSYDGLPVVEYEVGEIDDSKPDPYDRPNWHRYVYGGEKRKNL